GETRDDDGPAVSGPSNLEPIADDQIAGRLHASAVHLDVPTEHRLGGRAARLEEAGGPQPLVDPYAVHGGARSGGLDDLDPGGDRAVRGTAEGIEGPDGDAGRPGGEVQHGALYPSRGRTPVKMRSRAGGGAAAARRDGGDERLRLLVLRRQEGGYG